MRVHPLLGLVVERRRAVSADGIPPVQPRAVGDRRGVPGERPRRRAARARGVARRLHGRACRAQDIARLAIERGLVDAYRQVFAVLFWFIVLPGPAGAVLYRAARAARAGVAGPRARRRDDAARAVARRVRRAGAHAAVAARLGSGAADGAVVRDRRRLRGRGLVLAHAGAGWAGRRAAWRSASCSRRARARSACSSAGRWPCLAPSRRAARSSAWASPPEPEVLPSAVGLVWRALVLWLLVILLVTLAN